MKPLIYGYMRVDCDAPDGELDRIEQHMRCVADVEGFCYGTTFYEYYLGSYTAFEELTKNWDALRRDL